ncbi:hypothetical protein GCM10009610_32120 [Pseudonocardia xinjiangensis]
MPGPTIGPDNLTIIDEYVDGDRFVPGRRRVRCQPDGPNRSTRMRSTGTPASSSTPVAASAKPGEPHT